MIINRNGKVIQWLGCITLFFASASNCLADPAEITSVQVAPDFSSITIRSDGKLGKHSAFVIGGPFRLVVDFEATGLGKMQGKIRVEKGSMHEIRLGYHNNRARVVVDFGDTPVPAYQIERDNNVAIIALGKATGLARPSTGKSQAVAKPTPVRTEDLPSHPDSSRSEISPSKTTQSQPDTSSSQLSSRDPTRSNLSVKEAGTRDNLVFVEMFNTKDPRLTYRMIVDLDVDELSIRSASLSDSKGNLKKFEFLRSENELMSQNSKGSRIAVGPRRNAIVDESQGAKQGQYRWGEQSFEKQQTTAKDSKGGWPVRIEEFRLQARKADR